MDRAASAVPGPRGMAALSIVDRPASSIPSKAKSPMSIEQQKAYLRKMLILKLKAKYSQTATGANEIIEREVDNFIRGCSKVKDSDLILLEDKIKYQLSNVTVGKKPTKGKLASIQSKATTNVANSDTKVSLVAPPVSDKSGEAVEAPASSEWLMFGLYNQLKNERAEKEKAIKIAATKKTIRAALSGQVEKVKEKKALDKEADMVYAHHIAVDTLEWKEEEKRKEEALKKRLQDEKHIREMQIANNKHKKEHEFNTRRLEEGKNLERARLLLEEEEKLRRERKEKQREQYRLIIEENEKYRIMKEKEKEKEVQNDLLLMQRYKEKLDKEEEDRKNSFVKRTDKQAHFQELNFKNRAEEREREKKLLDSIEAHARRKVEEDARKEEEKKKIREKRQKEMNDMLKKQIEMKKEAAAKLSKENEEFAIKLIQKDERDRQEESRKQMLRVDSAMANRIAIEKQILSKQKESSTVGLGMTPDERKLNKGIIEEIKKDTEIFQEVIHRIGHANAKAASKSGSKSVF